MQNKIFQEYYQIKKPSILNEDLFPKIRPPQRSNSDPTSISNLDSNIENYDNHHMKNNSNDSSILQQDNNPINLQKNENEKENLESSSETNKNIGISQININSNQICQNF